MDGVVSPNQSNGNGRVDNSACEPEEEGCLDYAGFTALRNPRFRQAIDSDQNPVLCIENFFATAYENGTGHSGESSNISVVTSAPKRSHDRKRRADKKPSATVIYEQSQFKFDPADKRKVTTSMVGKVLDGQKRIREYKAIALAVDEAQAQALVGLHIDGHWIPMTCNINAIPESIVTHLMSKTCQTNEVPAKTVVSKVGKCKRKTDTGGEEFLFCILDEDSPFKAQVVNRPTLESLKEGRVTYAKRGQASEKNQYTFQYYRINLSPAKELHTGNIRHIGTQYPGQFIPPTRSDPSRLMSLACVAKTYFLSKSKSAKKVLDELEDAYMSKTTVESLSSHEMAVQAALGGNMADIIDGGSFVKCPMQVKHSPPGKTWREPTCSCHLEAVETCSFRKEMKDKIGIKIALSSLQQT